jgi:hypothetical protein
MIHHSLTHNGLKVIGHNNVTRGETKLDIFRLIWSSSRLHKNLITCVITMFHLEPSPRSIEDTIPNFNPTFHLNDGNLMKLIGSLGNVPQKIIFCGTLPSDPLNFIKLL